MRLQLWLMLLGCDAPQASLINPVLPTQEKYTKTTNHATKTTNHYMTPPQTYPIRLTVISQIVFP